MGSSSGSQSTNHHKRYSSPRDSISPYASSYAERRSNQYAQSDSHSRSSVMSDQESEEPTPRKRIAVACLRCRKRKIRCTGDSGNGQPCLNCKNAGHEPCQFLRVASHETPIIKSDPFTYSIDFARTFQARGASLVPPMPTPPLPSSYPDTMHVPSGEALSYKNSSAYAYGNKYYPVSTWTNGYVEDSNVDYAVYPQSYQPAAAQPPVQQQQDASYMMGYRMSTSSPAPMKHESSNAPPLYVEPNTAAYGYPTGHASATSTVASMIHRSAANTDTSPNYGYQSVASGIPSHMNTNERLLPAPSTRSLTSAPQQQHPYRAESISSAYSKTSQSSTGSSSPAALSEAAATTYSSFESSPLTSYPASASTSSHHGRSGEGYTTAAASSLEAIIEPVIEPLRMTAPEFTYKYTDTTRRYNSQYNAAIGSYLSSSQGLSNYTLSSDEHERKPSMRT